VVAPGVALAAYVRPPTPQVGTGHVLHRHRDAEVVRMILGLHIGDDRSGEGADRVEVRPRPAQAVDLRTGDVLGHRRLTDPQRCGRFVLARARKALTHACSVPMQALPGRAPLTRVDWRLGTSVVGMDQTMAG